MAEKKKELAYLTLFLVAFLWGSSFALMKESLDYIDGFSLMFFRFVFASLLMFGIYHRRILRMTRQEFCRGALTGSLLFCGFVLLITGLKFTTATKQPFVVGTNVLMVPFLGYLVNGKKVRGRDILGAMLAACGLYLLTSQSVDGFNQGDLLTIGAAFFYACQFIAVERFSGTMDPIVLTFLQFLTVAVLFFVLVGVTKGQYEIGSLSGVWKQFVVLVVVSSVVCFSLQTHAQRLVPATSASLILTLEAAFGSVFGYFYLNETLTGKMILGALIIFSGIFVQGWSNRQRNGTLAMSEDE